MEHQDDFVVGAVTRRLRGLLHSHSVDNVAFHYGRLAKGPNAPNANSTKRSAMRRCTSSAG